MLGGRKKSGQNQGCPPELKVLWRSRAAMLGDGAGVVAAKGSGGEEDVV